MDDILDLIQACRVWSALYDCAGDAGAKQLAEICQLSCDRVKTTVGLLTNVKQSAAILKCCQEIDRLESDADACCARRCRSCSRGRTTSSTDQACA